MFAIRIYILYKNAFFCVLYHNTRKILEIIKDVVNTFRVNYEVSAFSTITLRTKILFLLVWNYWLGSVPPPNLQCSANSRRKFTIKSLSSDISIKNAS